MTTRLNLLALAPQSLGTWHSLQRGVCLLLLLLTSHIDGWWQFGQPAIPRARQDAVKYAILLVNPADEMIYPGSVVAWNVYVARDENQHKVHLQIWRHVEERRRRFQLIGETIFKSKYNGHYYLLLHPDDRIPVLPGDLLGLYFPAHNPIPWTPTSCLLGQEHLFKYNPLKRVPNKDMKAQPMRFERASMDWEPCRHYSFNATVSLPTEFPQFSPENYVFTSVHYDQGKGHSRYIATIIPETVAQATAPHAHRQWVMMFVALQFVIRELCSHVQVT